MQVFRVLQIVSKSDSSRVSGHLQWDCTTDPNQYRRCRESMPKANSDMLSLINPSPTSPSTMYPPPSPTSKRSQALRKITPTRCIGELALHNVSFCYNSNPMQIWISPLNQRSRLFLPANELTFLVGSSGSGKSTVAQLLLGFQSPQP
jgi:ABC-type multidrug transport system fused ATPase/permease subunit